MRTITKTALLLALALTVASASRAAADDLDLLLSGRAVMQPAIRLASDDDLPDPTVDHPADRKDQRLAQPAQVFDATPQYMAFQPPAPAPAQPLQPVAPTQPLPNQPETSTPTGGNQEPLSLAELEKFAGPATSNVTAPDAAAPGKPDITAGITAAQGGEAVQAQHRSETAYDPVIRGFHTGEIYGDIDSAYWFAARPDLDTMFSKVDPVLVRNIIIIPGPFDVSFGPAFSFVDVQTEPVMRSKDGCFDSNYETVANYRTNGSQWSTRQIVNGGAGDWGFRLSAGVAMGSDYTAGNGQKIPSAYNNYDEEAQFSYDLGPSTKIDIGYLRFDQSETQYPGRLFDIDHLGTDAFDVKLHNDDVGSEMTKWTFAAWSNRTDFQGSIHPHPEFPTVERLEAAVDLFEGIYDPAVGPQTKIFGTTSGNVLSSGLRAGQQWGDTDCAHIDTGADFRFLQQRIAENLQVYSPGGDFFPNSGVPTSHFVDPGVYADYVVPWSSCLKTSIGARYDYTQAHASDGEINDPNLFTTNDIGDDLTKRESLWAAYVTEEAKLTQNWTLRAGVGHSETPPTLIELYADKAFIGIAQSGFTRVIGDPQLGAERGWMIDASIESNYDQFRSKLSGYYTWVNNYITLEDGAVGAPPFSSARLVNFVPTRLATLEGFEWTGEYDVSPCFSPFARMAYVYGTDQVLHTALNDIPPLTSQFGVRWHDPAKNRQWQVEFFGRADYAQDHPGYIRSSFTPGGIAQFEQPTPGFVVWNIHSYYYCTDNFRLVAGIDNILDRTYIQALDLRLIGPQASTTPPPNGTQVYPNSYVYEPGISFYFGFDWKY